MSAAVFAFYLFAIACITGGLFTVISRNPVHSVLWLILSFLSAAGFSFCWVPSSWRCF